MQAHKCMLCAVTLSAAVAFGAAAIAGDLPKEGIDVPAHSLPMKLMASLATTAAHPCSIFFGMRCIGLWETPGKDTWNDRGTCTYTDKDGNNIFAAFNGKTGEKGVERGTYEVIGGTGKFAGIAGSGEYLNPNVAIKADDKTPRGAVSNKISWKLP